MSQFPNAVKAVAVTPNDVTLLPTGMCEALWIGVGGTISFIPADPALAYGTAAAVSTTVPAGLFPVKVARVNATGTAATQILALY